MPLDQLDAFTIARTNTPVKNILSYHDWPGLQIIEDGREFLLHRDEQDPRRFRVISKFMVLDDLWRPYDPYDTFCLLHDRPKNDPDAEMKERFIGLREGSYKPEPAPEPERTEDGEVIVKTRVPFEVARRSLAIETILQAKGVEVQTFGESGKLFRWGKETYILIDHHYFFTQGIQNQKLDGFNVWLILEGKENSAAARAEFMTFYKQHKGTPVAGRVDRWPRSTMP